MDSLENDAETLKNAMRVFFQTMKRPQNWSRITNRSNVTIDRPSAIILKVIMSQSAPCHVQDLANSLDIEAPFITRKTQELERAGYLRRTPGKSDRRSVDLHLTSRGQSITKRLENAQREIIAEALKDWQPAERQRFAKLFERFSDDLAIISSQNELKRGRRARA